MWVKINDSPNTWVNLAQAFGIELVCPAKNQCWFRFWSHAGKGDFVFLNSREFEDKDEAEKWLQEQLSLVVKND